MRTCIHTYIQTNIHLFKENLKSRQKSIKIKNKKKTEKKNNQLYKSNNSGKVMNLTQYYYSMLLLWLQCYSDNYACNSSIMFKFKYFIENGKKQLFLALKSTF